MTRRHRLFALWALELAFGIAAVLLAFPCWPLGLVCAVIAIGLYLWVEWLRDRS